MQSVLDIQDGEYTVIATTRVRSDIDYWNFKDVDDLSTFKIEDVGYIGGKSKILGVTVEKISANSQIANTIPLKVSIAGAVAYMQIKNWNYYSDISSYQLLGNRSCSDLKFNRDGDKSFSVESKDYMGYIYGLWNYDSKYTGAVGYTFMFPMKNVAMRFHAESTDGELCELGGTLNDNIELGCSYKFIYDVTANKNEWIIVTKPSSKSANYSDGEESKASVVGRYFIDSEKNTIRFKE